MSKDIKTFVASEFTFLNEEQRESLLSDDRHIFSLSAILLGGHKH
jgi:hypothetical protein